MITAISKIIRDFNWADFTEFVICSQALNVWTENDGLAMCFAKLCLYPIMLIYNLTDLFWIEFGSGCHVDGFGFGELRTQFFILVFYILAPVIWTFYKLLVWTIILFFTGEWNFGMFAD